MGPRRGGTMAPYRSYRHWATAHLFLHAVAPPFTEQVPLPPSLKWIQNGFGGIEVGILGHSPSFCSSPFCASWTAASLGDVGSCSRQGARCQLPLRDPLDPSFWGAFWGFWGHIMGSHGIFSSAPQDFTKDFLIGSVGGQ